VNGAIIITMFEPTPYKLWDVNTQWADIPRDVLLCCPPEVVKTLEWCSTNSVKQHDPAWYDIRNKKIIVSGSILNRIVGEDSYKPLEYTFLEKIWKHPSPFLGNAATRWGNEHEDEAYLKWCQQEKVHGFMVGLIVDRDPKYAYRGGSPDGIDTRGRLIEIKCPYTRWIKPGVVPACYTYQPQFYMKLFNLRKAAFVQYKPQKLTKSRDVLDTTYVDYNEERIEQVLAVAHEFAMDVIKCRETGIIPENVLRYRKTLVRKKFKENYVSAFDDLDEDLQDINSLYITEPMGFDMTAESSLLEMISS
jgi:putative phage-type endonuclease